MIIDQCVKRLLEDEDYEIKHLEDLAIPTPQDSEQADHEDHSPHPPSSTRSAFIKSQLPLMHLLSTLLQQMEQREGIEIRQKIVTNPQFLSFLIHLRGLILQTVNKSRYTKHCIQKKIVEK